VSTPPGGGVRSAGNNATRALFTGDLNHALGAWLAHSDFDLAADVLKVPHHGAEGCAPNEFFARVHPKAALVPAPKSLWLSDRSKQIRDYFAEQKIPTYVSGIDGNVTVVMTTQGFTIRTEHAAP
jgi:competence protein ComEC